jgi:ubiquitin carboxyl-terminal hydrolase 8
MQEDQFSKYQDKGLTGLANVGNSCYINSCIQCLSHTYEFNDFLDNKTYTERLNANTDSSLLVEWDSLRIMMWKQNCTIAPHRFINMIQKVAHTKGLQLFTGNAQNDIQEFLLFIIECFHNAISRSVDMSVKGDVKNLTDGMAVECFKMMSNMYTKDYSEIIRLFYGIHVSSITSTETSEMLSMRPEPFFVLSVSLPHSQENRVTLISCIDDFCKKERLVGENAWFNEKTNKKQDVDKGVSFWSFPEILVIHLKRWDYEGKKDQRLVTMQSDRLDLSSYVKGYNHKDYVYELYGICDHHGGVAGGHYTATIKNANSEWYVFNDASVTKIGSEKIINSSAYCLFFRKKNSK